MIFQPSKTANENQNFLIYVIFFLCSRMGVDICTPTEFYTSATDSVLIIHLFLKFCSLTGCFGWSFQRKETLLFLSYWKIEDDAHDSLHFWAKKKWQETSLCFWVSWPILQEIDYPGWLQNNTLIYNRKKHICISVQVPSECFCIIPNGIWLL